MSGNVTGIVESKSKTGKSIKVNGEWYNAYLPGTLTSLNVGDNISFDYTTAPKQDGSGNWMNIKGKPKLIAAATASSSTNSNLVGGIILDHRRVGVRQTAINASVAYHITQGSTTHVPESNIIDTARIFEAYMSGDLDEQEAMQSLEE